MAERDVSSTSAPVYLIGQCSRLLHDIMLHSVKLGLAHLLEPSALDFNRTGLCFFLIAEVYLNAAL